MDEDIGAADQVRQDLPAGRALQVNGDAALVAVAVEPLGAHALVSLHADIPVKVPLGRLDLDDVGAHVAESLSGERTQQNVTELDYACAL